MLSFNDRCNWTPAQARNQFRHNYFPAAPTGGISSGYAQVSVHMMPSSVAGKFAEFCRMNRASCPLVYQSKPGQISAPSIAADLDIRTDQSMYGVFVDGICTRTVPDILDVPFDDLVCFYLGCSHSFEHSLTTGGLPVRHQEANRSVPSYCTKIPCIPSGPFTTNQVVTMRGFPRNLVQRVTEVTAVLEPVHGAPVHIGHPCWLGIKDLSNPEYDDPPYLKKGDVCMYWGCGTTATSALTAANLPLLVSLSPTANCCDFITDLDNESLCQMHLPEHGSLVPKVRFISENLLFGSLLSDKALEGIEELGKLFQQNGETNHKVNENPGSLVIAALRLSHASSVAIVTVGNCRSSEALSVLSIIKAARATGNKDVTLLVPDIEATEWRDMVSRWVDTGILKKSVRVIEREENDSDNTGTLHALKMMSNVDGFKPDKYPFKYGAIVRPGKQGGHWVTSVADLTNESEGDCVTPTIDHVTSDHEGDCVTPTTDHVWPGDAVAAAMYILNGCPIHSRYVRRGLGLFKPLQAEEFMMNVEEVYKRYGEYKIPRALQANLKEIGVDVGMICCKSPFLLREVLLSSFGGGSNVEKDEEVQNKITAIVERFLVAGSRLRK